MTTLPPLDPTLAYHENQAETNFAETVAVDMAPLYARYLAYVPPGGHILDAGCGSGRDALAFRRLGYGVTAFEASSALAGLASEHCGLPVEVRRFQEVDWESRFDGIWACASLLHVSMAELPEVLHRLRRALKPDAVLYASFKYGAGEREDGGRRFTDLNEASLTGRKGAWTGSTGDSGYRGSAGGTKRGAVVECDCRKGIADTPLTGCLDNHLSRRGRPSV
jgi:SAM-dependent methyltransferase